MSTKGPKPNAAALLTTIGRYQVREQLGRGAFGTVYRGYDPQLDREVALKLLNPEALISSQAVERFRREARAAAKMHHPHIVPVYDAGEQGDQFFIASALIPGRTLASLIPEGGVEPRRAAALTAQLAEALAYAHKQGVLHRDVKPANIMVDEQDTLYLMDFGLAAWIEQSSPRMTRDGAVLGTPSYMAPEQASGDLGEVGPAADLYAAGVVLYELLTGRVPFEGPLAAVIYHVIHVPPQPPSQHRAGLDSRLEAICLKALAKKPADRFAGGQEMVVALQEWLAGQERPPRLSDGLLAPGRPPPIPVITVPPPTVTPQGRGHETVVQPPAKRSMLSPPSAPATPEWMSDLSAGRSRLSLQWQRWMLPVGATLAGMIGLALLIMAIRSGNEPKAGEEREYEIASGVKMKFCWIPPGKAQLGSPKAERDAVWEQIKGIFKEEPEWLQSEAEAKRPMYSSKGFWLGKYAVTQQEWAAVMNGDNPSWFRKGGKGEDKVPADTSRFPVEQVPCEDCEKFLAKLNDPAKAGDLARVFGKRGKFVLPHEDEWEYACRGGKGNRQAYYFGNELNGTQADCFGTSPFGTSTKGPDLWRTTEVGSYAKDYPHPWGLCDMHGNVWQWCENNNNDDPKTGPAIRGGSWDSTRGGSWDSTAWRCRSAHRYREKPGFRAFAIGCRACFRLD